MTTLAGCGAGPTVHERSAHFTVTLDDYTIRPQRIVVPAGERLTISVVNHGQIGHTFRIGARTKVVLKIPTIAPGETRSRTFTLGRGSYTTFDALANQEILGMRGTLVAR
jgi:Cupredoxin-like domain